jgi:hypothetical protein
MMRSSLGLERGGGTGCCALADVVSVDCRAGAAATFADGEAHAMVPALASSAQMVPSSNGFMSNSFAVMCHGPGDIPVLRTMGRSLPHDVLFLHERSPVQFVPPRAEVTVIAGRIIFRC